jgi:CDP-diacylglycerol--serine O-phosphatidyltransferase
LNAIVKQIPNLLTLSNLLCGCLAIKYAFEWDLVMAAYLVGLAAVFDFLDGFAARLLKVSGEMGKQLDSLADMVSFGVVPGVVMFQMMRIVSVYHFSENEILNRTIPNQMGYFVPEISYDFYPICFIAFLIPLLSAYRLAKFNIDTRQTDKFIGLPTPANSIFILSLPLILNWDKEVVKIFLHDTYNLNYPHELVLEMRAKLSNDLSYFGWIMNFYLLAGISLLFSILLISELPLFALKFKNFGWTDNKIRYVFLIISLAMLIIFQVLAIPFIVILYLFLSIVNNLIFKQ